MRNIKFVIRYDGTTYKGWQRLSGTERTLQGKIESYLSEILGEKITITGCGRTDAGVHALKYTLNFHTESAMPIKELEDKFRKAVPMDIQLLEAKNCSERFHARYNALHKTYLYKIDNSEMGDMFSRKYKYQIHEELDIENMRNCAKILLGTHDFQSFTSLKTKKKSTERKIFDIDIDRDEITSEIHIKIRGNGFLWNMVRIIAGTLIEAGLGKLTPSDVQAILDEKKRAQASSKAPAFALYLLDVEYSK